MPDSTLSQAIKEAYASATPDPVYITVELRHPNLSQPIRVVCDHVDLVATLEDTAPVNAGQSVTFQPYAFDLKKPEVTPAGVPTAELVIDNVSREIVAAIEEVLYSQTTVKATFREYVASDLTGPQNDPPMHMDVLSITADVFQVKATLGFANMQNKKFPTLAYEADTFPSLAE